MCKNDCIWNPAKCTCENGKYVKSVVDNYKIVCDEIIETTKIASAKIVLTRNIARNFQEKKVTCKTENFYILLAFLLITMMLLIVV